LSAAGTVVVRRGGHVENVMHRLRGDVGEIDDHAEAIHLGDDELAERRQAVVNGIGGG